MGQTPPPNRPLTPAAVEVLASKPDLQRLVTLGHVAAGACRHQIASTGRPALAHGNHMVERGLTPQAAIAVGATPTPGVKD